MGRDEARRKGKSKGKDRQFITNCTDIPRLHQKLRLRIIDPA